MATAQLEHLTVPDVAPLDPYQFMALIRKRVIHPGGRQSTDALLRLGAFEPSHQVLDVGCGVATTAIRIARDAGSQVTAADISPLMLDRARANVRAAGLEQRVTIKEGG